jgi:hypothetical protein
MFWEYGEDKKAYLLQTIARSFGYTK